VRSGDHLQQVRAAGNLGNIPLVVLASNGSPQNPDEATWHRRQIEQVQPGLARLSSRGRLVVLDGPVTAGAIVLAIRDVVNEFTATNR
jgi:hypothetical protein